MNYDNMSKEELIELLEKTNKKLEQIKIEREEFSYYAKMDSMTNVLNKREGMNVLKQKFEGSKYSGSDLTVCFIDVDDLKKVNDMFGHEEGDRLLINISNVLRQNIRKEDIVFRMGGDEFIIIFPNTTQKEVKKIWDRVCNRIDELNKQGDYKYQINLSYGFSEYCNGSEISMRDLINRADKEMYKNKLGKNKGF